MQKLGYNFLQTAYSAMYRFAFRFVALAAASTNVAVNPDGSLEILEEDTSVVQMFETEDKQTVAPIPENTTVEPSLYWTPDFMRCCTQGGLAKCNLTQAELQDDQDRMEKSSISDIDCRRKI